MDPINLSMIDTNRLEGRLVIAAVSMLTTQDRNPDQVLSSIAEIYERIYADNPLPETQAEEPMSFSQGLRVLINKHSMENLNDTPDFILAGFLNMCLNAYSAAVLERDKWFAVDMWDDKEQALRRKEEREELQQISQNVENGTRTVTG